MYYVLTCNGYRVETFRRTLEEAISDCRAREIEAGDCYARVVSVDGQIVADANGAYPPPERYVDHATTTGMYDRY